MEDYGRAVLVLADRWSNRIDYLFIKKNIHCGHKNIAWLCYTAHEKPYQKKMLYIRK